MGLRIRLERLKWEQTSTEFFSAWVDVETQYVFYRHYQLFAVLAGVRNGEGFAGVKTGEVITPISRPRGLPKDCTIPGSDHSESWLRDEEMLNWYNIAPVVLKTGVISPADYANWNKTSAHNYYSGDVIGHSIRTVNDNLIEMQKQPNYTHVRVTWEQSLKEELFYFFREVKRLKEQHSVIRFVFGFDS